MFFYDRVYNYSGSRYTDETGSLILEADLPHASWVGTENNQRMIRLGDRVFRSIDRHAVWAGSNRWRGVRPWGVYVWGDQLVFREAVRGRDWRYELGADLRFSSQFDATFVINQTAIHREQNDSRFAEQVIPRLRLSYQFSKELALRWITELRSRREYDVNDALTKARVARAKSIAGATIASTSPVRTPHPAGRVRVSMKSRPRTRSSSRAEPTKNRTADTARSIHDRG